MKRQTKCQLSINASKFIFLILIHSAISCNGHDPTPQKVYDHKYGEGMRAAQRKKRDELARRNGNIEAYRIMASGIPHWQKKLEKDGMESFMEYTEQEKKRTWAREERVRKAGDRLSERDKEEYFAMLSDGSIGLLHTRIQFLIRKGVY